MKSTFRNLVLGAAALFAAFTAVPEAFAAQQMLCAPDAVATATGGRRVGNPAASTTYALNSAGCAVIAQADIGWFLTQGYTPGSDHGVILFSTGVQTGTTDLVVGSIPAGAYIQQVVYSNSTANAVTGNISIGTTANGTDVVASQVCGANCLANTANASILKQVFSTTVATPLHAAAITSWNSANVTITIIYGYF